MKLKEMEEEYQILMFGSDGKMTEEIRELGERIDSEKEFIESKKLNSHMFASTKEKSK